LRRSIPLVDLTRRRLVRYEPLNKRSVPRSACSGDPALKSAEMVFDGAVLDDVARYP